MRAGRIALGASAVIGVLVLSAVLMLNDRPLRERDLDFTEVAWSVASARSVHFTGWCIDSDTGERRTVEGWVKNGSKLVMREEGGLKVVYDGRRLVEIRTRGGFPHATVRRAMIVSWERQGMSYIQVLLHCGFLPRAIIDGTAAASGGYYTRLADGSQGTVIKVEGCAFPLEVTYDLASRRPVKWLEYDLAGNLVGAVERFDYDAGVPESRFAWQAEKGLRIIDLTSEQASRSSTADAKRHLEADPRARLVLDLPPGTEGSAPGHWSLKFESMSSRGLSIFRMKDGDYRVLGKAFVHKRGDELRGKIVEDEDVKLPGTSEDTRLVMLPEHFHFSED